MERIPILKMGEFLLVSIQVDMHDRLALQLQDDLTTRIAETTGLPLGTVKSLILRAQHKLRSALADISA